LTRLATAPSAASTTVYRSPFRLAAVRTNLVADASSSAEPLVQHVNADRETVATAGEEGDGGGPATQDAPANLGTCDPKYWSCPGAAGYKVRGQTYLKVQCKKGKKRKRKRKEKKKEEKKEEKKLFSNHGRSLLELRYSVKSKIRVLSAAHHMCSAVDQMGFAL